MRLPDLGWRDASHVNARERGHLRLVRFLIRGLPFCGDGDQRLHSLFNRFLGCVRGRGTLASVLQGV
jgi:hypothetical protein